MKWAFKVMAVFTALVLAVGSVQANPTGAGGSGSGSTKSGSGGNDTAGGGGGKSTRGSGGLNN
jgi:hypothetical protein